MRFSISLPPVGRVAAGTAGGQVAVILTTPFLTRLYGPTEFGLLAVVTAISALGGVFVSLRLDMALPLADSEELAAGVAWAAILACLILSPIVSIFCLAAYALVAGDELQIVSAASVIITVLATALLGLTAVAIRWLGRDLNFKSIALISSAQGWLQALTQLALFSLPIGLLIGLPAGRTPCIGVLFFADKRPRWPGLLAIKVALRRFRSFPLISSWGAAINTAGLQAPALLLGIWAGASVVGSFLLAQRLLAAPTMLLAQAMSEVNYSELAKARRESRTPVTPALVSTVRRTALVAVPLFTVAALVAPASFGFIFGNTWASAGSYVALLCPGMAAQFIVIPISRTLLLLEQQGVQTIWECARLLVVVGAMATVATLGGSIHEILLALTCAQIMGYATLLYFSLRLSRIDDIVRASTPEIHL